MLLNFMLLALAHNTSFKFFRKQLRLGALHKTRITT